MIGCLLLLIANSAPTAKWAFALGFAVLALQLALHLYEPARLEHWLQKGYLFAVDAVMLGLALLGSLAAGPFGFVGIFAIVFVASLVADRRRSVLAGIAVAFVFTAANVSGVASASAATFSWLLIPLALASSWSFGTLSERLPLAAESRAGEEQHDSSPLLEIAESIGSSLDIDEVMRHIVKRVGEALQTDSCSILLSDAQLDHCFVVASKGHPDVDMLAVDLDNYPEIRRAIETRQPVVIDDVENDPLVAGARDFLLEKGYRSLLVVPLVFGREVIGALFLRGRDGRPYSAADLRFCQVAAGISANSLKNAMLFREVSREAERHRETGEKLRRVLDGSPDVIIACDEESRITEFNRGAGRLFDIKPERAIGRTVDSVLGAAAHIFEGVAADPEAEPHDVVVGREDGSSAEVSLAGAALCGAGGQPAGRVWIGRDVTKLRRVEKSLAQAERLSSLGEVVAGVAHELNNPLAGVMGYAELLRAGECDPHQMRDLERIVESSQRCQKIVLKLLSFARKHTPEKNHQSLNECLEKVLDLKSYHLRSSQVETTMELDRSIPKTSFDFHQIEQVALNLLNNAEQAIGMTKAPGEITIRSGATDSHVWFEFEDNGPGVPPAVRGRVFDPFFTTKDYGQGTGLGLSVSFGIVREHDGTIELVRSGENGSVFRVELPIVEAHESDSQGTAPTERCEAGALNGCRILVAEDEPGLLDIYDRVLRSAGATVTLARDGEQAWEQLSADDFEYDLIVTDLLMPNLNGRQLYERVAEERPDLLRRFVFTTGDLAREDTLDFLEGLPNRILSKPLQVETVTQVLSQAMVTVSR